MVRRIQTGAKGMVMLKETTEDSCATCRFSRDRITRNGKPSKRFLACHRRAPVARLVEDGTLKGHQPNWPIVSVDDWCGEHEKRVQRIHRNPFKREVVAMDLPKRGIS